ncbi:MAG: peptide ABC transporter substrate-binding protein [Spirochaetaceae bacterium]|jgi:peptide/nickel transport system substrate-binding protein/oligopeptide transport system substrate-binding protein|nr:peptide ABC transporter substrate-binding protein [Spirochaetaceae bacterium]
MYRIIITLTIILTAANCGGVPARQSRTEQNGILRVADAQAERSQFPGKEPDFAATRPRAKIRDELTIAFPQSGIELDFRKAYLTHEAQLFTAVYEGLFSYHPFTMEPVPGVAVRWSLSEDKKEWTFTLRKDAKYWNGDPVTAEHFRSAWLSLLHPSRNAPYASLFDIIEGARAYRMGEIRDPNAVGIIAPDDETLIVRLSAPAAFFRSMLCHHAFSPIHPAMLNKKKWSQETPISNGPFYIKENKPSRITLLKNTEYWDAKSVSLNKLLLKFIEDGNEAAALWNSGEARWIYRDVNMENLTDLSGIMLNPMFSTHYYFIRSRETPWSDHRVRRALALALPWDQLRQGYLLPATTLIYPLAGYPHIAGIEQTDLEEARRLLASAGYPNGTGLPVLVVRLNPSAEAARAGALMLNAWRDNLGVPVKIEVIPYNRYEESLKQDGYGVGSTTWIGDFADPYSFLEMWRRDSTLNYARYNDAEYETLMDRSMLEEGGKRMEILAEAEKLLLDRGAVLPIFYSPALNIVDVDEIEGWYPNALDIHPFKYLSFKTFKPLPGVASAPGMTPAAYAP